MHPYPEKTMSPRRCIPLLALVVPAVACAGSSDLPLSDAGDGPAPALPSTTAPNPTEKSDGAEGGGVDLSAGACLVEEKVEYQGEEKPALTANIDCSEPHAAEVVAVVAGDSFLKARDACKEFAADEYSDIPQERFYLMGPSVRGGDKYACLYDSAGEAGYLSAP